MSASVEKTVMSDTFFTAAPHWTWWIIFYFFIGGMAGTAFLLGALLDWQSRRSPVANRQSVEGRDSMVLPVPPTVRHAYYLSFIGVCLSGLLLTIDLTRPLRFWHMLIQNHTGKPMFKAWE